MKYKIISGNWGEGHKAGDVIDMDFQASRVRLELGEIIPVKEEKKIEEPVKEEVEVEAKEEENDLKCPECGFIAKNKNGLRLHSKKHKK